jgi:predicted AlkP superfamily pyrophosphatase or phosphodiesterase
MSRFLSGFLMALTTMALLFAAQPSHAGDDSGKFKHVLLISIDGMHAVDFINCSKGINGGAPYCPNLAKLAKKSVTYLDTSTSKPSDSFPGLTAIVSGGGPRTEGAFYDVAYDRSLDPPTITTGNGVAGTGPSGCTPGAAPTGQPPSLMKESTSTRAS